MESVGAAWARDSLVPNSHEIHDFHGFLNFFEYVLKCIFQFELYRPYLIIKGRKELHWLYSGAFLLAYLKHGCWLA